MNAFDAKSVRRGFQVYKEVCSTCHSVELMAFRNLVEYGAWSEAEAKVGRIPILSISFVFSLTIEQSCDSVCARGFICWAEVGRIRACRGVGGTVTQHTPLQPPHHDRDKEKPSETCCRADFFWFEPTH